MWLKNMTYVYIVLSLIGIFLEISNLQDPVKAWKFSQQHIKVHVVSVALQTKIKIHVILILLITSYLIINILRVYDPYGFGPRIEPNIGLFRLSILVIATIMIALDRTKTHL